MGILNGTRLSSESTSLRQSSDAYLNFGAAASYEWWLYPTTNTPWLTLETGLAYVSREIGYYPETDRFSQLQLSVLLRRKWRFLSIGAGTYAGLGLGGIESSTRGSLTYEDSGIKRFDFGWQAALGFHLSPWGKYNKEGHPNLLIEGRFLKSILDASADSNVQKKFVELQIMAGVRFCLARGVFDCTPIN